jgi:hypothetical protein
VPLLQCDSDVRSPCLSIPDLPQDTLASELRDLHSRLLQQYRQALRHKTSGKRPKHSHPSHGQGNLDKQHNLIRLNISLENHMISGIYFVILTLKARVEKYNPKNPSTTCQFSST